MQAVIQPQLAKVTVRAPRRQTVQPKSTRPNPSKNTGRRFLDLLMAALSGTAV